MRILALAFMLLLAMPVVAVSTAQAQTQQASAGTDDLREGLRGALNQSRQFLGNLLTEAKSASGLNDEQLYAVGVGLLGGLLVADVVGTGGIGTVFFAGAGGLFGKWATAPAK
ncbi:MAG: hypothetical protein WCO00_00435 [Rhodospirillaceae bacterium]